MRDISYIFFHTAAFDGRNADAGEIDRWHRARGWNGIGYNYVIIDDRHDTLADGEVEKGRNEDKVPAHVAGVNSKSIGICCVGHGDHRDFTARQKKSLAKLVAKLCRKYDVPVENVLGHREVNRLVAEGKVGKEFRTSKTCPGTKVDTDEIRSLVARELGAGTVLTTKAGHDHADSIKAALALLAENSELFGNAEEEWKAFYNNGEIRSIMA
ncbi:MAG: peptidoglycan recognition protein family protein [Pseudomonadota bacterium]|nr:peptidoglycan recognition protein family protein [Pseudomonadota bacterium]